MEQPSSSKVTVEYYDPSNVYQLLKPGLLLRLPLRNLHWESHFGPLRSIDTLHVDLVPALSEAPPPPLSADTSSLSRVRTSDSVASGDDGFRVQPLGQSGKVKHRSNSFSGISRPVKERRHQIPGLRQTPYLKVFLLRCDDNDTYKAQSRREVREWIKEHSLRSQSTSKSNSSENHDAFEWLIIHVIVPNTAAATQPRTSGKGSESASSTHADKSSARWRGGGSSTILEKLKADFNGSSKSAVDRIAQIRIGVNDVPYDILPRVVPAIPGSYTETAQDNEGAWADLIFKLKFLILASFDMRVTQYEEDIREKDGQRALPGWNFCTFFVLKEGLARGFESVGLVEDALVGYDELSVRLDAIIQSRDAPGLASAQSNPFLPFTEDLRRKLESLKSAMNNERETSSDDMDSPIDTHTNGNQDSDNEIPLSATKKNYRDLILSNNISIFDFRCYLFSRQLSLLLRLGNAWSSRDELLAKLREQRESSLKGVAARQFVPEPTGNVENMGMLSEICKRSLEFAAAIARIMRDDMIASQMYTENGKASQELRVDPSTLRIIDNMVASFTFSVAQQILAQTSTKSLPIPPSTLAPTSSSSSVSGHEQKTSIPAPETMMHPTRNSSLSVMPSPTRGALEAYPGRRTASASILETKPPQSVNYMKVGIDDLAAQRADLYMLSRSVLEALGKQRGWPAGWDAVRDVEEDHYDKMEEIDLDGDEKAIPPVTSDFAPPSHYGIDSKLLRTALGNKDDFYRLYETLTDKALRHYAVGDRLQSTQANMADLAILKYHLKDYASAASYFYRLTPFYGDGGWEHIEMCALVLYAKCLKQLDRKEDYIKVLSKLLLKKTLKEKENSAQKSIMRTLNTRSFESSSSDLEELVKNLTHLDKELSIPMANWYGEVEIEGGPQYHGERDSFALDVRLQYLLHEKLAIDHAQVRIIRISGGPYREIWLENNTPMLCSSKNFRFQVTSNVIAPGTYVVDRVVLKAQKITLNHKADLSNRKRSGAFLKSPQMLLHQQAGAFDLRLFTTKYMHLDRDRFLELELSTGWNEVISGEIHFKAGTAGLRLRTSGTEVVDGTLDIKNISDAGVIKFGALAAGSITKLRFSFNLEHDVAEISIKIEAIYTTDQGIFTFATNPVLPNMLPVGVNVQDIFKHSALFSKFMVSSSSTSPLRLLSSKLESSELFKVDECGAMRNPIMVFPRQPASLAYKITPRSSAPKLSLDLLGREQKSLSLVVEYIPIEEEINSAIKRKLSEALEKSPLHQYKRLITTIVTSRFHKQAEPHDMERTGLLGSLSLGILSQARWRELFTGLGRMKGSKEDTAVLIADWLHNFIAQNPRISLLPVSSILETEIRSIVIPVDIPNMTVVHTVDLVWSTPTPSIADVTLAAINEPLPFNLLVKWSRIWDMQPPPPRRPSQTLNADAEPEFLEFVYELVAPPDTWLIGGRRKGHFQIPSTNPENPHSPPDPPELRFPIILIPLREGYLPYPLVEIKPAPVAKGGASDASGDALPLPAITCETDFQNVAETIRVVADMRSTTVNLDASGPSGGAWLIESERRGAVVR